MNNADLTIVELAQLLILISSNTIPNLPLIHHHGSDKIEPSLNPQPNILLINLLYGGSHSVYLYITIDAKSRREQVAYAHPKWSHAAARPRCSRHKQEDERGEKK